MAKRSTLSFGERLQVYHMLEDKVHRHDPDDGLVSYEPGWDDKTVALAMPFPCTVSNVASVRKSEFGDLKTLHSPPPKDSDEALANRIERLEAAMLMREGREAEPKPAPDLSNIYTTLRRRLESLEGRVAQAEANPPGADAATMRQVMKLDHQLADVVTRVNALSDRNTAHNLRALEERLAEKDGLDNALALRVAKLEKLQAHNAKVAKSTSEALRSVAGYVDALREIILLASSGGGQGLKSPGTKAEVARKLEALGRVVVEG